MNSPAIFAKLANALGTLFRCRKMKMSQLGDRMAKRIIHLPQRAIAAMNVRYDAPGDMPRGRSCERFDAIADEEDDVALQFPQAFADSRDGNPSRLCNDRP